MSTAVKQRQKKQEPPEENWDELLRILPGYDPFLQSDGYEFRPEFARHVLAVFPKFIKHVEGSNAGEPFVLEPWQKSILANLFGWKKKGTDVRRYREVFMYIPRGNGKTAFVAAIAIYIFFFDKEPAMQGYIAAGEREQAGFLFRHVKGMVLQEPALESKCKIYGGNAAAGQSKSLVHNRDSGFLRVIAADGDTQHGGNTHLAIIDEVHVQKNRDLFEAFRTSMAKKNRLQPLLIGVTTADFDRESLCNEWHARACRVRDNDGDRNKPGYDPAVLPVIYETLVDEDWTDEKVWEKANPNIDISVSRDELRRECKEAQENPASENSFRRLHLNQKTAQDCRVIPMDKWDEAGGGADPVEWRKHILAVNRGAKCFGGLDLGAVADLTSLVLIFGSDSTGYDVVPWFWGPEENAHARERNDGVPYIAWARQGFMTLTDGNETDYALIRREVSQIADSYGVVKIAGDRLFQGAQLMQDLLRDGIDVVAFGQGFMSMAAPTRRFLELVAAGKIRHGNNPILRWMAGNAAAESEHPGNDAPLKFSKKKSKEKIDGIIGATMAVGLAMGEPDEYLFQPGTLRL